MIPVWLKIAGPVAAGLVIAAFSWWVTATYFRLQISETEKRHALEVIIAKDNAAEQQEAADQIKYAVDAEAAEARARRAEIALANMQRIASYVSPETDRLFPLPCGFVRLHDAGARGLDVAAVSLPAGKTDGDRCEVTTSFAAAIVQRNYALALDWKAEVDNWWDWYDRQKAQWDAYRVKALSASP